MKTHLAYWQWTLLLLVFGTCSIAASNLPDPTDPDAPVAPLSYPSAFSDYRPYREQMPLSWKEINEQVAGIPDVEGHGGHGVDATAGTIEATGVIRTIDKAGGKVVIAHDPITALGWPAMTMLFKLKDNSSIDPYKEGDRVQFYLEKSDSDYAISGLRRSGNHDAHEPGKGESR